MGRKGDGFLYSLVQKFVAQYAQLKKDRDRRKNHSPSLSDSESGSDKDHLGPRPVPDDQLHVVYTEHSRTHLKPTLMHLVEFVGEGEGDSQSLAVHTNLMAVCSCAADKDPYDETVWLYKTNPSTSDPPLLDNGEHFLGGSDNTVALTSAGILITNPSPEDWTVPLKSYLGIPSAPLSDTEELAGVQARLTDKLVNHRTRFFPTLSPAVSRRQEWGGFDDLDEEWLTSQQKAPTRSTQSQTIEDRQERGRFALPASAIPPAMSNGIQVNQLRQFTPRVAGIVGEGSQHDATLTTVLTPLNKLSWNLLPEHAYLHLDKDIPNDQWGLYGLDVIDHNHPFDIQRPISRGDIRTLTKHHNLGQNLTLSPTTIEDTLSMAQEDWTYPNLFYPKAMRMIQEINFPEIIGKELDECVIAWKETRSYGSLFSQSTNNKEISMKFANEAELFKQPQASKYLKEHSPMLRRPLKEVSPAYLEKHLRACIQFGIRQGLHYTLWFTIFSNSPNLRVHMDKVKLAAGQYPKYQQILEKMASFWVHSLRPHASQDTDYDHKQKEYLEEILARILKGESSSAVAYLRSEADVLKAHNPVYAAEAKQGGLTDAMQKKAKEGEIRRALLSLLSSPEAPLKHIWYEMVQNHLRENPSGIERGPSGVQKLPIEELIMRFKNACDMNMFMEEKNKISPPGIYNSSLSRQEKEKSNGQIAKCDKCKRLDLPCSPHLKHCTRKGHQKGQDPNNTSPRAYNTILNCPHCLTILQRNITKDKQDEQPTAPVARQEGKKCGKCQHNQMPCHGRLRHCRKPGHQANKSQDDTAPRAWNFVDSCSFCAKENKPRPPPIRSIFDESPPPISVPPMLPTKSQIRNPPPPFTRLQPPRPTPPSKMRAPFRPQF